MNERIQNVIDGATDKAVDIYDNAKNKAEKVGHWVYENPQATVSIIASIAMLIRSTQSFVVSHRLRSERNRIDKTYYDRSTGHHWQLRRKLTNTDRAVIERRKKRGDDMFDILSDLGVI